MKFYLVFNTINCFENEIHTRICAVYGAQNVITKSTVNRGVQRLNVRVTSTSNEPQMTNFLRKDPGWYATGINKLID